MLEVGAGVIIFTKIDHEIKYVVAKEKDGNYDFLKGPVEENESFKDAALRHIKEYTDLDVELIPNFEKEIYYTTKADNNKKLIIFLAKYKDQEIKQNNPEIVYELMPYKKAKEAIDHNDIDVILDRANDLIFKNYYKNL